MRKFIYSVVILLAASLSACSTTQTVTGNNAVVGEGIAATSSFNNNPNEILENATQKSTLDVSTQFAAANALIKQQQYYLAMRLLKSLDASQLSAPDNAEKQLYFARIGLLRNRPGDTLDALKPITDLEQLPVNIQIQFYKMRAAALLQLGQVVNSVNDRITLNPLLSDDAKKENAITIWKQMQRLSIPGLQNLSQDEDAQQSVLAGWAQLTLIVKQYGGTSAQQLAQQLAQWRQQYPNHPANLLLPESFDDNTVDSKPIQQVALLLPMQGPFKSQAEAVMNGFFAAYHRLPKTQQPKIKIYDTAQPNTNISDLYDKAVSEGAQFVIGPLTKANVQSLTGGSCAVPTIFLNYTQADDQLSSNCYQFGISPVSEAQQAATRAWLGNYDHAVVISPQGDWGQSIADSFKTQWQTQGGLIVGDLAYDSQQALAQQIAQLMGTAQSNERAKQLRKVILQTIKFIPRRRKDVGVIFINATNAEARQIVPLLKFNFTGRIPIFATSLVYNGIPTPSYDRDLNGVRFLAMPWSVAPTAEQQQLRSELQHLWPTNFRNNSKLYGLGIDSLKLMRQLDRMQLFPEIALDGVTGQLRLQQNHIITQKMVWAEFVDGKPTLLAKKDKALYGE